MFHHKTTVFSSCLAALIALAGCSSTRVHTYPPNLVYLDQQQIESTMRRLLVDIWTINDILDTSESVAGYNRERVISALRDMESAADELGAGAEVTNHLVIDNNIDQFKSSVRTARQAVEDDPPNYFLAGQMSGNCQACHRLRQNTP